MSRFPYPPLFSSELQPGTSDDPLTGTVLHRQLSPEEAEIPEFEALSYCWGDQSHTENIQLTTEHSTITEQSGQRLESGYVAIGPNLASALRALRDRNETRILWCDSICINQQDVAERSAQVQRMHDVYEFASRVIVWLGPATSWSHTAMEMLRWVENGLTLFMSQAHDSTSSSSFALTADRSAPVMDDNGSLPLSRNQWLAFEQLLALDWHRRLWTYQEIALANRETSIVKLGSEEMAWSHRSRYTYEKVRDRLYALRGLMEPDAARSITVDYTKSLKQILASAFVTHTSQQQNLDFLEYCDSDVYPSWVVDLERPIDSVILFNDACGRSACSTTLAEPNILEVAGVSCDEICSNPYIPSQEDCLSFEQYIADAVEHIVGNNLYHDDRCLNELLTVMGYGNFWDYSINKTLSSPDETSMSLEDVREIIRKLMVDPTAANLPTRLLSIFGMDVVSGYAKTRDGSFVRVPTGSQRGDIVVTLLGLRSNLVLRPQAKDDSYLVIGPCYHPGFSDGQALLGNDFGGWERGWCNSTEMLAFWKEGQPICRSDPRLEGVPLPDGYTEHFISITSPGTERPTWLHKDWKLEDVRKKPDRDPRMSEVELKKRGVPVQRFRLI
ncbi:hypothetical protein FGADI_1691 [Fusarium gaditjirri]|uniref:Heterokaryon incompatibility domain-containing protein n=1 Tax=Fusarium gaditjirri TaxID=282569 RepID=A0A8H4TK41_9HYPO|nr:hypothetical protein FGADI_1691 [Fusarium gaditjirri]